MSRSAARWLPGVIVVVAALLMPGCSNGKNQATRKSAEAGAATSTSTSTPATTRVSDAGVARKLVRAEPLGKHARRVLRRRMLRHGDDMENLLWAALMLDYGSAATIAKWIAEEPRISRPVVGQESALNSVFPAAFFAHQDQMHAAASELSKAAAARDDGGIAAAYARLTSTCVHCHSLYLKMPASSSRRVAE